MLLVVVKGKRCLESGVCLGNWNLKDFVRPDLGARQLLQLALNDIANNFDKWQYWIEHLGFGYVLIHRIWDLQIQKVKYCYDNKDKTDMDVPDFWFMPSEAWFNGKGDCEDKSALQTAAMIESYKLSGYKGTVYHCIGYYTPIQNGEKMYYGHGFPLLVPPKPFGTCKVLWLESTFSTPMPIYSATCFDYQLLLPVVFTDGRFDYVITDFNPFGIPQSYIKENEERINAMLDYVTGKKVSIRKSSECINRLHKDAISREIDLRRVINNMWW